MVILVRSLLALAAVALLAFLFASAGCAGTIRAPRDVGACLQAIASATAQAIDATIATAGQCRAAPPDGGP